VVIVSKEKQIRGGKVTSINSLRSSVKKGSGGGSYLSRIPADASLTVRFLTEPTEWIAYFEYYDAEQKKFFPSIEGVQTQERPAARYLANALDVVESRVIPLVMPKSVAASLLKKYDKYATLLDRDYELSRSGAGLETEYDVTPEPPTKMNLDRYDLLDLMGLLESQLEDVPVNSDDDDEEEDKPVKKSVAKAAPKAKAPVEDDEDEDDEDSDDESLSRDDLEEKSLAELKILARAKGVETKGLDTDALIDALLGEAEDDDEDDEVLATGSASDDDEESDEDSEDDEEYEEITEDDLHKMSMKEIKDIALEYELKVKAGASKEDIIQMIIDVAGEEEEDEDKAPF
jgi:hypothetical protein